MPAHMPSLEHSQPPGTAWNTATCLLSQSRSCSGRVVATLPWAGPALSAVLSGHLATGLPSTASHASPSADTSGPPREQGPVGLGDQPPSHLNVRPTPESLGGHVVLAGPSQALSRGCVPGEAGPCGHPTTELLLYVSPGTLLWSLILPGQGGAPPRPQRPPEGAAHPSNWDRAFSWCGKGPPMGFPKVGIPASSGRDHAWRG